MDTDSGNPIGQGIIDRLGPRTRRRLAITLAGLVIATIAIIGYNQSHTASAEPGTEASAETISVPADACADPDVYEAVQSALLQPNESVDNSLLALPSEVAAKDRATQEQAWQELDDSTREFQLCLRLVQDQAVAGP